MSVAPVQYQRGQVLVRIERVALRVAGHLRPVDAAHVLAPAEDLADEAFDAGQRRAPARYAASAAATTSRGFSSFRFSAADRCAWYSQGSPGHIASW